MSGISKRVSGAWVSGDYGIMKTATDTITTLPAIIYPNDTTATVGISGNTVHTGTPTPDNPIMPQGTGERTGNLYDYSKIVPGYTYDSDGQMILNPDTANRWRFAAVPLIEVESGATYLRTYNLSPWGNVINFYDSNKNFLERATPGAGIPVTVPSNCNFVSFVFRIDNIDAEKYMFTKGSTAPTHFEPYGYKIPISSANTTTPVYLGEVESTRRIKKLVLTGEEDFVKNSNSNTNYLYYAQKATILPDSIWKMPVLCNELPVKTEPPISDIGINTNNTFGVVSFNFGADVMTAQPSGNTVAGLKEYLAQQYAAGTPVTIWYVLATPETGIVNEPLMKIGDYADTVSGITIPTTAGANSFDVLTTLKPSEVTVNYKGWHPVSAVHERENGAWT